MHADTKAIYHLCFFQWVNDTPVTKTIKMDANVTPQLSTAKHSVADCLQIKLSNQIINRCKTWKLMQLEITFISNLQS